jgi:hypothetical protein
MLSIEANDRLAITNKSQLPPSKHYLSTNDHVLVSSITTVHSGSGCALIKGVGFVFHEP